VSLEELRKILDKNPTIYTYTAQELSATPQLVEEKYRVHVRTHISLPDLKEYVDRLTTVVLHNQAAFIGGLFGEYGLGKTSTSLYLWDICEQQGLIAVPPYVWKHFSENYEVLFKWVRYRLGQANPVLQADLDELYEKYTSPSLEKLAEEASQRHGLDYQQALTLMNEQWETGILKPELPEEAYLDFLSDVSDLVKKAHFKGVVVFFDELQVTVEALSLRKSADILQRLAAGMMDRTGSYGLFIGMPYGTHSELLAERKDIFDRLQRQRCFIDLSLAYSSDFPKRLWTSYSEQFGFKGLKIVSPEALDSIGQICDANRRDLGNGPRSVVSALNRIVECYLRDGQTYGVEKLVDDCLRGEIVLGQESKFAKNVLETLGQPFVRGKYERVVRLLAAFPQGAPQSVLEQLGAGPELADVIQRSFGDLIYENANGYALVSLRKADSVLPATFLDSKIKQFHKSYALDSENARLAIDGFRNMVLPYIFSAREGMHGFQSFDGRNPWTWMPGNGYQSAVLTGTFENALDFPMRVVRLNVCTAGVAGRAPGQDEHFSFIFNLKWSGQDNAVGTVANLEQWTVAFHLDLMETISGYNIPTTAPGSIPSKQMTPFFLLALVEHLRTQSNIPKHEENNLKFVLNEVLKQVTLRLFNASLLSVHNADIQLNNVGRLLLADLFWSLCKQRFPQYRTLVTQPQWQRKIGDYVKTLELEKIRIRVARGHEPLDPGDDLDIKKKRDFVAQLFNVSLSSFETWASGLPGLIDLSRWKEGVISFQVHPLETEILGMIKACPDDERIKIGGNLCQAAEATAVLRHCRALGYTEEEIQTVMLQLGQARKLFKFISKAGRSYVYYEPVSADELKSELTKKLSDLEARVDNLKTVPGFTFEVRFSEIADGISTVQSVEEFDALKQTLHGYFERINRWIARRFQDLATELEDRSRPLQNELTQFEGSGHLGTLKQNLAGNAIWISDLSLIQKQLQAAYEQYKSGWQTLHKVVKQVIVFGQGMAQTDAQKDIAQSGDVRLMEYCDQVVANKVKLENAAVEFRSLRQNVIALTRWVALKVSSDQTWELVLTCQQLGNKLIVSEFQGVSEKIRSHLKRLGQNGLQNSEGFLKDLQEVQSRAELYRTEQRKTFLQQKEQLQQMLKGIQSGVSVLRTQFSDANPTGAYQDLFSEAWEAVRVVLDELTTTFTQLYHDLQYAATYLGREEVVTQNELPRLAHEGRQRAAQLGAGQVRLEDGISGFDTVAAEVRQLRARYADVLSIYRKEVIKAEPPSTDEEPLLRLVEKGEKDLKEVILSLSGDMGPDALEKVLSMMISLFRKNQITIRVRRPN
jgi:hypothetical protein